MMAASVSAAVARWNGRAPVAISNSIAPSAELVAPEIRRLGPRPARAI
jgi:hypothetical protein